MEKLRVRLAAKHFDKPQNIHRVGLALDLIEEGLRHLAGLGHQFHLELGPENPDLHDWPRTYFHLTAAPNGRPVNSRYDLADLGPGWFPTLQEAQLDEGLQRQMHGRGGLPLRRQELTLVERKKEDESEPRRTRADLVEALRRAAAAEEAGGDGLGGAEAGV